MYPKFHGYISLTKTGTQRDRAIDLLQVKGIARLSEFRDAGITAARRRAGRPISQADCQIAAIAVARGGTVVTRNVRDFEGIEIAVVNPWESR